MSADACPGVLRLHEAADGYLARVRLPGGRIDAAGMGAVAEAATLGNGIVELTSRAGLQVRGLPAGGAEGVAEILGAGGLLPSVAHDRVRNIVAPPLGGRSREAVAEIDAIVDEVDRALCADLELAELPGRFLFGVDDGSRALDPLRADVELAAEEDGFRLYLAGCPTERLVAPSAAAPTAIAAARAFVALVAGEEPVTWRVKDLPGGAARLAGRLGLGLLEASRQSGSRDGSDLAPAGSARPRRAAAVGVVRQRDGPPPSPPCHRSAGSTWLSSEAWPRSPAMPRRSGSRRGAPSPSSMSRPAKLRIWRRRSASSGSSSPRSRGGPACRRAPGLGACARARVDVRAAAARRALRRDAGSEFEHWSGCERRCGEPGEAGVKVVATPSGLVVHREEAPRAISTVASAVELLNSTAVPG